VVPDLRGGCQAGRQQAVAVQQRPRGRGGRRPGATAGPSHCGGAPQPQQHHHRRSAAAPRGGGGGPPVSPCVTHWGQATAVHTRRDTYTHTYTYTYTYTYRADVDIFSSGFCNLTTLSDHCSGPGAAPSVEPVPCRAVSCRAPGAEALLAAVPLQRRRGLKPLWLRMEWNLIDPAELQNFIDTVGTLKLSNSTPQQRGSPPPHTPGTVKSCLGPAA
jgi:hypothetical protein